MNALHNRSRERDRVLRSLHELRRGTGGVVLVEGESGIGRSRLLADAAIAAERQGITVCAAGADELTRWTPLGLLASALDVPVWTAAGRDETPVGLSGRLLAEIEDRLRRTPLLIALDDVQWSDPVTLAALRSFPAHLAGRPVGWVLARREDVGDAPAAGRLFDRLAEAGAVRLRLSPLDDGEVTDLMTASFGAVPGPDLAALAAGAGGNPELVTELVAGLSDDGGVEITDGATRLVTDRLPARLTAAVRRRLSGFSADTTGVLEVAAVLGRSCHAADVAEVMGRTAPDILRAIREVLRAGILTCADDTDLLTFRHELVRRGVLDSIAPSVLAALHRQAGLVLVQRGEAGQPAAVEHLLRGALPGDAPAVRALERAADRALDTTPAWAAAVAAKATTLTCGYDDGLAGLSAIRAAALLRAGRLAEAAEVVADARTRPGYPAHAARLRTVSATVLALTGRRADALAESLASPDDHPLTRAARLATGAGRLDTVDPAHDLAVDPAADLADDAAVAVTTHLVRSGRRWVAGDVAASLDHARLAAGYPLAVVADLPVYDLDPPLAHPGLVLAVRLAQTGDLVRAGYLLADATREIDRAGHVPLGVAARVASAWVALLAGRLGDAAAAAPAGLDAVDELGITAFAAPAHAVLAAVALRRGDLAEARRHLSLARPAGDPGDPGWDASWGWLELALAEATLAPDGVVALVDGARRDRLRHGGPLLLDPGAAACLVRAAVAADDRDLARLVTAGATDLARRNPGCLPLAAAARHARGLLEREPLALYDAVDRHRHPWSRASAAEDLAAVLAGTGPAGPGVRGTASTRSAEVVRALDAALAGYQAAGANRDVARVRSRLRAAGIRRRHWTYGDRAVSGWGSLTETERDVVDLVTEGLTNRQVAARMFVSPHTVHAHLGRVFRKLGVNSRVELAGLRHRAA